MRTHKSMTRTPATIRALSRCTSSHTALIVALATSLAAGGAMAQSASGGGGSTSGSGAKPDQATSLEEVTVTARKVKERLIDVPVVASVMSAVQLKTYNTNDLEQLDSQVLGVHIFHADGGGAGGSISIRGVGNLISDYGAEQPVSIEIDGMAFVRGHILGAGMFDMQSLEVLKGPQSLFFGKNSPAGVVNITSNNPGPDWGGYVKAGYEFRTQDPTIEGAVNIPITDKLKARVALRLEDMQGGWLQNTAVPIAAYPSGGYGTQDTQGASYNKYPQTKEVLARITLAWNPNDRFSLNFKAFGSVRHENDGNPATLVACAAGIGGHPYYDGVPDVNQTCDGHLHLTINDALASQQVNATLAGVAPGAKFFLNTVNYIYTLNMSYKFDNFDVTSTTGVWDHREREYTGYSYDNFAGITSKQGESGESWQQEIRVHTDFNFPFNATVGAFFEKDQYAHIAPIDLLPIGAYPLPGPYHGTYMTWDNREGNSNQSYSFFFQGNWKILPNLELAGGGRWSHETRHAYVGNAFNGFDAFVAAGYLTPEQNPFSPGGYYYHPSSSFSNFSPEVTLSWHPVHDMTVYAAYKTGYLAAGISNPGAVGNLTALFPNDPVAQNNSLIFKGETVDGFEGGVKGTFLGGRLSGDFDVYRYSYNNLQVAVFNPQTISFTVQNAAAAINEGVEFQSSYRFNDNFQMHVALAYNHLAYGSYTNAQCYPGQPLGPGQCLGVSQDYSGKQYGEPPFQAIVGATYDRDLTEKWAFRWTGDMTTFDRGPTVLGQPNTSIAPYTLVNMSLKFYQRGGPWEVALIGTNITNTLYVDPFINKPLGNPGDLVGILHPPRMVTLQFTRTF